MRVSPLAPLLSEPSPVLEPFPDLALEAALDRLVERVAAALLGPIVLAAERFGRVVIVLISCAIALALHEPRRRVEDALRRRGRTLLFRQRPSGAESLVDRVRFRRGRDIDHGFSDRQFAL